MTTSLYVTALVSAVAAVGGAGVLTGAALGKALVGRSTCGTGKRQSKAKRLSSSAWASADLLSVCGLAAFFTYVLRDELLSRKSSD